MLTALLSADEYSPLGCFMITDQDRMERFVNGFPEKRKRSLRSPPGEEPASLPICTSIMWSNICDEHDNVIKVKWSPKLGEFSASVSLDWLPPHLIELDLMNRQKSRIEFTGSLVTKRLPAKLCLLRLSFNGFTGCIDFSSFPSNLREIRISGNRFAGEANLTMLPKTLEKLDFSQNKFTGKVSFEELPSTLQEMSCFSNDLQGTLDVTKLPASLFCLVVSSNRLSGVLDIDSLPQGLKKLYAGKNEFSAVIGSAPGRVHLMV